MTDIVPCICFRHLCKFRSIITSETQILTWLSFQKGISDNEEHLVLSSFLLHVLVLFRFVPTHSGHKFPELVSLFATPQIPLHFCLQKYLFAKMFTSELGKKKKEIEKTRNDIGREFWFFLKWLMRKLKLGVSQFHLKTTTKILQGNIKKRTVSRRFYSLNILGEISSHLKHTHTYTHHMAKISLLTAIYSKILEEGLVVHERRESDRRPWTWLSCRDGQRRLSSLLLF